VMADQAVGDLALVIGKRAACEQLQLACLLSQ
jgi:hypothetical protein